jgi:pectinesterase
MLFLNKNLFPPGVFHMKRAIAAFAVTILLSASAQAQVKITATNKLPMERKGQTVELAGDLLPRVGPRQDLSFIHVTDASGKEVLAQAVDTDFDAFHKPDMVVFQADFGADESKNFTVSVGAKQTYEEADYKVHGRFNRERFDDFAWENDKIAHRTYGKGLETWEGEPLISSTIDIWSKNTPKMVVDKWYMVDDYHADHGEGADFYSAGDTRGDGGSGIWSNGQLFVSRNFVQSRVLSNGPIRLVFELDYEPFKAGGSIVAETRRITLDAGSYLDHYTSTYKVYLSRGQWSPAAGLKKVNGETVDHNAELGILSKWERVEKNAGMQGLAIVADPKTIKEQASDNANLLVVFNPSQSGVVSYYAGFCWDKAGEITTFDQWKSYLSDFAKKAQSPIEVKVAQ